MPRRRKLKSKHIELAASDCFLAAFDLPSDPEESLDWANRERERYGVRVRTKLPTKTKWAKLTTALPWCVLRAADWEERSTDEKAAVMWHELVHIRQQRAHRGLFFLRYMGARWRWAYEVQAYRETIRAQLAMGASNSTAVTVAKKIESMLPEVYRLGRLDPNDLRDRTRELLLRETSL